MKFSEAAVALHALAASTPHLFSGVTIDTARDGAGPFIGTRISASGSGMLVTGDGVGSHSGIYCICTSESDIVYIGKATKNNLHHRIWDHVRTPSVTESGDWHFPRHRFGSDRYCPRLSQDIAAGLVRLGIVTVSDPVVIPLLEVYLQTLYIKQHGILPAFNLQIG